MATSLSEGSLEAILSGGEPEKPVIQILGIKRVANNSATERYRLQVSDGKCSHSFALIATQWNEKIVSGELPDYTIIRIERYITTSVSEMKVMVIMDLTVLTLGTQLGMKIGNPMTWQELNAARTQARPAAQTPASTVNARLAPRPTPNISMNSIASSQLSTHRAHPIASLSPYQNTWVIKARVMNKSAVRTWSNARGEGKLFSMDLCDESGEIRATAFKDQCDKFYDMIEVDKVYSISRCTLKPANKNFSNLNNDYEMTFTNDTVVEECSDTLSVPSIQYNFIPINEISDKTADAIIDVIGVCKTSSDIVELVAKSTGRQLKKRDLGLVDESGCSVNLTLWGSEAEQFDGSQRPIVAIRGARVTEFNGGKSLSVISSTVFKTNPDIVEAHKLRGWFDNGGSEQQSINMSARVGGVGGGPSECLTFADVEERQLGSSERGDYFSVLGCLTHINTENAIYKACPLEQCNKKLIDQENGLYRCEKCDKEFPNYKYRLILTGSLTDNTGSQWVTLFNESAEAILGKSSNDIGSAFENDKKAYISMFEEVTFKDLSFKIRVKLENFGDETRLKFTALNVQPIDYKVYNTQIIQKILDLTGIQLK